MSLLNPIIKSIIKGTSKTTKKNLAKPTQKDFENVSKEEVLEYIETLPLKERLALYGSSSPLEGKFKILDSDKIDFYEDVVNFKKLPSDYKSGDNSLLKAYLMKNDIPEKYVGDFDAAGEFKNVTFFKELTGNKVQITIPPSTSMGRKKIKTFKNPSKKQIEEFFETREKKNMGGILQNDDERYGMQEGGTGIEALKEEASVVAETMGDDKGSLLMDDQMLIDMTPPQETEMKSDDDMEEDYTRFIMDEALSEEEEDMLVTKLEQDEELQMLFDKVIDVAQEFAGSGPVEGPGTGVSDDIPARLSDGEFVFTAKAVEEIGEDSLMSMMKEAEAAADERQGLAIGGIPQEKTNMQPLLSPLGVVQDDRTVQNELTKRAISGSEGYIKS